MLLSAIKPTHQRMYLRWEVVSLLHTASHNIRSWAWIKTPKHLGTDHNLC